MLHIAFALLATVQTVGATPQAGRATDIKQTLAQAETLYYDAHFGKTIELLTPVEEAFKTQPGRLEDRVEVKVKLALANIGMNETARALSFLIEMYALKPDYVFDTRLFSPKVIALANEARTQQSKARCETTMTEARKHIAAGDTKSLQALLASTKPQCAELAQISGDAADALYKDALAAYRRSDLAAAVKGFEAVLSYSPEHELALQYLDIIKSKSQLENDRLLVQWQRDFNERRFAAAADGYKQILAQGGSASAAAAYVTGQYREALTQLADNWPRGCAGGDAAATAIRSQVADMIPEPSFGQDIRQRMSDCPKPGRNAGNSTIAIASVAAKPAAKPAVKPVAVDANCLEMTAEVAMTRIKTKVDPVLPKELRQLFRSRPKTVVRVKARIDEAGDVSVLEVISDVPLMDNVLREALDQWKFTPIRDREGPRCADTEIPFVMSF